MPMQLRSSTVLQKTAAPKKAISKAKNTSATALKAKSSAEKKATSAARAVLVQKREMLKSIPIGKAHQQLILDMKTTKIEPLTTTLKATPASRPALRAKIERQIANKTNNRGAYTRGWIGRSPKPGRERAELLATCGPQAFLRPNTQTPGRSGFPVVARVLPGKSRAENCQIDCGGAQAAFIRARQHGHTHVAEVAVKILEEKCPDSARARAKRAVSAEKKPITTKRAAATKGAQAA